MEELKQSMKVAMASTFVFYMKAHYFHFNVEGIFFKQFHDLFGAIYEEVYGSIDQFGEEIRALGSYAPMSIGRYQELSIIEEPPGVVSAEEMVAELMQDNAKVIELLNQTFEFADSTNEQGLADFIAGRLDSHKKHAWMLRATSKG